MTATSKVFCIGFHKTGTSSLGRALKILGYRVCGPRYVRDPDLATRYREKALALLDQFDAFQDNPWPLLYEELDQRYPDAKFVLTFRPTEKWLRSVVKHFADRSTPMRELIYGVGSVPGNEDVFVTRYERHNQEVTAHFAGREGKLLQIDVTSGEEVWPALCGFLGREIPDEPFPWQNKAGPLRDGKRAFIRLLRVLHGPFRRRPPRS